MFITNVSLNDIKTGNHPEADVLIQIVDPDHEFPTPKKPFAEVHRFRFWDAENDTQVDEEQKFSPRMASELTIILEDAIRRKLDVVVHCHAGLCRSGAVVEVASMMGMATLHRRRQPNMRMKSLMLQSIGYYDY